MEPRGVPLTRRALHRGRRRAVTPGLLARPMRRVSQQALAAATAAAFVAGGIGAVCLDTVERQDVVRQAVASARQARVDRAATVRLTAAAAQLAAAREAEALAAAEAALAEATAVLGRAPEMVGEPTVVPLDRAVAELAALVRRADLPVAAASDSDVAVVADVAPAAPPTDEPAAAAGLAEDPDAVAPPGTTEPAAQAGTQEHGAQPADEGADETADATTGLAAAAPGGAPAKTSGVAPATPTTTAPADPTTAALELAGVNAEVLDLETSTAVLAAAREVAALSAQVTALADEIAAELAAAAEAAEARRAEAEARRLAEEQAALRAAMRRLSSRIAATDAAPNGQIPVELLCSPRFTRVLLRCDAAAALDRLNDAYRAAFGTDLAVSGGYRTLAEQEAVRATKGDLAATPGTSNHGRGLAVDFSGFGSLGQFSDPDYLWMVENGARFGWYHPPYMGPGGSGPLEPWHWEFGRL